MTVQVEHHHEVDQIRRAAAERGVGELRIVDLADARPTAIFLWCSGDAELFHSAAERVGMEGEDLRRALGAVNDPT